MADYSNIFDESTLPPAAGAPPPGGCPEGFEKFSGLCYMFGNHASYLSATVECQKVEAELVQINDRNYDYLSAKIAASSGNDNWIGGGQMGGKTYKKSGTKCPIIRGSGSSMGPKISTLDCSVAAPFVCMYNPMAMMMPPGYGAPGAYPYPPAGGAAPAPYPYPYPAPPAGAPPAFPGYGMPPGYGAPPNGVTEMPPGMSPPLYEVPENDPIIPDYDVDYGAEEVETEEDSGGGGTNVVLPILVILLVCCAFFAYRYYKKNYGTKPEPPKPKTAAPPKATEEQQLSPKTPQQPNKNMVGWTPPGQEPKSFDNPVFRESNDIHFEADEFRPDELPPGMTMEDPRNPNQSSNRKSRRGESRYHDEHEGHHNHNGRNGSQRNRKDHYKEFEIPEGIPSWDHGGSAPVPEMESFESGKHTIFDQMRSPQAGGPPNSMSMSRDYRQMYNDEHFEPHPRDKIYEISPIAESFSNLPDVVPEPAIPPRNHETSHMHDFYGDHHDDYNGKSLRHGSSGPSRPPLPEKIKSKREDIMKARTLIPDAPKNATNLDQLQADVPQYRAAPPKPGEAAMISVPSMAQFQARPESRYREIKSTSESSDSSESE